MKPEIECSPGDWPRDVFCNIGLHSNIHGHRYEKGECALASANGSFWDCLHLTAYNNSLFYCLETLLEKSILQLLRTGCAEVWQVSADTEKA